MNENTQHESCRKPRGASARRHWWRGAASIAGCAAMVAGTQATAFAAARTPSSSKVVNITYWNMWSGIYTTWIDNYVSEFNASHPGIHVTALSIPSTTGDEKLLTSIAAGDPPSVFTEWNPVIGTYAQDKAIQPLDQYLSLEPPIRFDGEGLTV